MHPSPPHRSLFFLPSTLQGGRLLISHPWSPIFLDPSTDSSMALFGVLLVSIPYSLATWTEEQFSQCDQNKLCFAVASCTNGKPATDKNLVNMQSYSHVPHTENCSFVAFIRPYSKDGARANVFSTRGDGNEIKWIFDGTEISNCTLEATGKAVPTCQMKAKITVEGEKKLKFVAGSFASEMDYFLHDKLSKLKQRCLFGDLQPFKDKCNDRKKCVAAVVNEETLEMKCGSEQTLEIRSNGEWNPIKSLKCNADKWETEDSTVTVDTLPKLRCATPSTHPSGAQDNSNLDLNVAGFSLGTGAIVGIAVAVFFVVVIVCLLAFVRKIVYCIAKCIEAPYFHNYFSVTFKYNEEASDAEYDVYDGKIAISNLCTRKTRVLIYCAEPPADDQLWTFMGNVHGVYIAPKEKYTATPQLKIRKGKKLEGKMRVHIHPELNTKPWKINGHVKWH